MARTISANLKTHFGQEVTTIAICWKFIRRDGVVMGLTSHDEIITYEGLDYVPLTTIDLSTLEQTNKASPDNLDVSIAFSSAGITKEDIHKGLYDGAELYIFALNYKDLAQGILKLISGRLGEVTLKDYGGKVEFQSLSYALGQNVGRSFLPTCDVPFCSPKCGLTESSYTVTGTITGVASRSVFTDSSRSEADDYFKYGRIEFTSGDCDGFAMEIKAFASGQFTLFNPMPANVAIGDTYSAVAGCDKTSATCKNTFDNLINFRGFPWLPGRDELYKTPNAHT